VTSTPAKVIAPAWEKPSSQALDRAASTKMPLVICFPDEKDDPAAFADPELVEMAAKDAVFIKMPYTSIRDKAPGAEESVIPTSKLLSDNPARDYRVPVGKLTLILADCHGNEYFRLTSVPKAKELKASLEKIPAQMEKAESRLRKNYDSARAAWDKQDQANALKPILKNFKEGLVGLEAQQETITLYNQILEAGLEKVKKAHERGDMEALKGLSKDFKGTSVGKAADDALKNPIARVTQEKKN
jgi:hypothetical protein